MTTTLLFAATVAARVAPDARRLILIRHGAVDRSRAEPRIKPGGFYGGNVDVPLSGVGEAEALAAAKLVASEHLDEVAAIWSSPMRRALFGARAVGTALAVAASDQSGSKWQPPMNVETFEEFREVDRGPIGKGWTDLSADGAACRSRDLQILARGSPRPVGRVSRFAAADEIEARDGPDAIEKFALETRPGVYREINGGEGFCDLASRVLAQRDAMLADEFVPCGGAGVIVSHMWVTRAVVGEALGEPNPMKVDIPTASISIVDYPEGFSADALAKGECAKPTVQVIGLKPEL